jgi:N-acetyl sugar amidotransferase
MTRICTRCILSSQDTPNIHFNEAGVCNYCTGYDRTTGDFYNQALPPAKRLEQKVEEMKRAGNRGKYDCILGLSGGSDSSYLALWAKQKGLRPLVVHLDNGWNSELAVKNIHTICEKLGLELHTHVIEWDEFKELQLAYLRAGVVDIEVLTDHAIHALIYSMCSKYNIRYSLSGFNYATEAIMPKGWTFNKRDFTNIKDIYQKFGAGKPLKTFPSIGFLKSIWYHMVLKIESIQVLNYIDYHKEQSKEILKQELSWRDYGGKHFESVFTKFYQVYILPRKFGIDKRKAHLSNLICSGQITREQALVEIEKPICDPYELEEEKLFILKKFGLSNEAFEQVMQAPVRSHESFKTDKELWNRYFAFVKMMKKFMNPFKRS